MPKGSRLVTAIAFSGTGKYIAASDAAEKITVHLFDRAGGSKAISAVTLNMKVANLAWNPNGDKELCSAGAKHLALLTVNGGKMTKEANAPSDAIGKANMTSVSWFKDKKNDGQFVSGGSDGYVYHWGNIKSLKTKIKNGKGSV